MEQCPRIQKLMAGLEPLSPADREHVSGCPACRPAEQAWTRLDSRLREAFPPYRPAESEVRFMVARALEKHRARRPGRLFSFPYQWVWVSAAAAALLFAFLWRPAPKPSAPSVAVSTYTASFNSREVALGNQTRMILKPGAVGVVLANTPDQVAILLEKGEAFFQVKPHTYKTFSVHAADLLCVVTGTRFVVNRENEFVRVSVINGKVDVKNTRSVAGPNHLASGQSVELALLTNRLTHTIVSRASLRQLLFSFAPPGREMDFLLASEPEPAPAVPAPPPPAGTAAPGAPPNPAAVPEKPAVNGNGGLPEIPWAAAPPVVEDWLSQFSAFMQQGHFDLAVSTLHDQLNKPGLTPDLRARLLYQMATLYRSNIGNYPMAIRYYSEYLTKYPLSPERENALFWLAECYRLAGNRDLALKNFREYLSIYPKGYWTITTAKRISWLES